MTRTPETDGVGTLVEVSPRTVAWFRLLDVSLTVDTDDVHFVREFASVFGGPEGLGSEPNRGPGWPGQLRARLDATDPDGRGIGTLHVTGDDLVDPASFLLSFSSPTVPIRPALSAEAGWTALAIGSDAEPALWLSREVCRFRTTGRWRRILAHFLFLRLLRLRSDALFFHAASLGVAGRGVLLVGPKGSGKSTLALALAARGHAFLGDETACYLPASRQLVPFWRPVGIKPGPQSAAIRARLERVHPEYDEDGLVRLDISELLEVSRPAPVPLAVVLFLRGFASRSDLAAIEPGREELSQLQPLAASLTNRPATARVFEMIRMLGGVRVYRLEAGAPDDAAALVERVLGERP